MNAKDNLGGSVFMLAVVQGNFDAIRLMLDDPRLDKEHLDVCSGGSCPPVLDQLARCVEINVGREISVIQNCRVVSRRKSILRQS